MTPPPEYYLDSANRYTYSGHTRSNLRAAWDVTAETTLFLRVNNLADKDVAERANFAVGTYRYPPGA